MGVVVMEMCDGNDVSSWLYKDVHVHIQRDESGGAKGIMHESCSRHSIRRRRWVRIMAGVVDLER
jgi:hypothetical protein